MREDGDALILIVSPAVAERLEALAKRSVKFVTEDSYRLFGFSTEAEGQIFFVATHAYSSDRLVRNYASINDDAASRWEILAQHNGLSVSAYACGLENATSLGFVHCHPPAPNTGPSGTDIRTCRDHCAETEMRFCVFPIVCSHAGKPYWKWYVYDSHQGMLELPRGNVAVLERETICRVQPQAKLERFLGIRPEYFLQGIDLDDLAFSVRPRPVDPSWLPRDPVPTRSGPHAAFPGAFPFPVPAQANGPGAAPAKAQCIPLPRWRVFAAMAATAALVAAVCAMLAFSLATGGYDLPLPRSLVAPVAPPPQVRSGPEVSDAVPALRPAAPPPSKQGVKHDTPKKKARAVKAVVSPSRDTPRPPTKPDALPLEIELEHLPQRPGGPPHDPSATDRL